MVFDRTRRTWCRTVASTIRDNARWFACTLCLLLVLGDVADAGQSDRRLVSLFSRLDATPSPNEARGIESEIWRIWIEHGDRNISKEMVRGIGLMNRGDLNEALEAFDGVTRIAPDFAEGWNKRATVHFMLRSFDDSVRDIAKTLKLEPRHFGALSGLGLINAALGRYEAAIKAYEKALSVHPHLDGVRQTIRRLKQTLKGQET